ncbi:MAG TPA: pilus assembly protein PilM [Chthoniobacteraceae bacterium]|nr:pilus assembly protein PilM [Chthoniobacteraceae bacterium]
MAKPFSSAIGIDLGRHSIKAVLLQQRRQNRCALTHFALRELDEEPTTPEALGAHLGALLGALGGKAKAYGLTLSGAGSFVRIVQQPKMEPALLREALRLNGATLLNQNCKEMVLDCDLVPSAEPREPGEPGATPVENYLVGGLPRSHVALLRQACQRNKIPTQLLQLDPVALLNAFEFSDPETFASQAFVLVDIGHRSTTVSVGAARELIMVRTFDFGGESFVEELICHGAASQEEIFQHLAIEEVLTVENARLSLSDLVRSIAASINYVETRHEATIPRISVSGGLARSPTILKLLTEELQLPCDLWNPFGQCEIALPASQREAFAEAIPLLGSACGAAAELIRGRSK